MVKAHQEELDVAFWGAHGADGFRKKLISVYGTVATAWRVALDKNDNGKLSHAEYITVCRDIGFSGNLKKVWKELDTDRDGFITLQDIDPEAHKAISKFMGLLFDKYGSTLQGWREGLDVRGTHRLEEKEFMERCTAIGYDGDSRALFRLLRIDPHNKCITLKEIDPQAALALKSGDPCAEHMSEGGRSSPTRSPEPRCFSRQGNRSSTNESSLMGTRSYSQSLNDTSTTLTVRDFGQTLMSVDSTPPGSPASNATRKNQVRQIPGELNCLDSTLDQRPVSSPSMVTSMSEGSFLSSTQRRQHFGAITPTRASTWTRELSNFQRDEIAERNRKQDEADKGIKTVAGLRSMLLSRYGTMYAAWRQALDIHEKGQLSFGELCEALRHIGYTGSLKAIFNELDPNKTGFISLKDLDPKQHATIVEYKELVKQKYGNLLSGWVQGIDKNSKGCTDEAVFTEHCKAIGFPGDAKTLFTCLQSDKKSKYLYLRDWDIRAFRALSRGDHMMITEEHKEPKKPSAEKTFDERQESSFHQRWARHQAKEKIAGMQATMKDAREADVAAGDLKSFKQVLVRKYGTLASAWRCGVNPEGLHQVPFQEFASVLRIQGFCGSVRKIWLELEPIGMTYDRSGKLQEQTGFVTLENFDLDIHKLLEAFRAQLKQKFGDIITGWLEGLDPYGVGRLEEAEFLKRFKQLGFEGDARKIFINLQERGRSFIVLKDIEPKAMEAVHRGDLKAKTLKQKQPKTNLSETMLSVTSVTQVRSPSGPLPPLDPSTTASPTSLADTGCESPSSMQGTQPLLSQSPTQRMLATRLSEWSEELGRKMRHETVRSDKEEKDKWMGCTSLDGFRQLLVERYGSTVTAWRCVLDADGNGRVSFSEFCKGCRCISYHGNVKELWAELKGGRKGIFNHGEGDILGHVEIENLDPEADRLLRNFREFMLSKHKCVLDAWHQWLDDGGNVWLDEAEFQYKLEEAGYDVGGPKQCHQLFICLMPDKASRHLHVEDLQIVLTGVPNAKRNILWSGEKKPPPPVGHRDPVGRPLELLKSALERKFGCLYAGWWRGIDVAEQVECPWPILLRQR
jgi:Ca2+-binding EF-hand superfamily protein